MALSPIQAIEMARANPRVNRRPRHTFNLLHKPFVIQPFLIAPVLPGETMRNLLLQSRVVTDPLKNGLIGWWIEYYFFYVKHRDMVISDNLQSMMLDPEYDAAAIVGSTTASTADYFNPGTAKRINWVGRCLTEVVNEFFREEGEAYGIATIHNRPVAKIQNNGIIDSIIDSTLYDPGDVTVDGETMSDLDQKLQMWEFLRAQQLTNMSYEDYLKTFGVRGTRVEVNKPELIRYVRDWQYPSNTVNPANGTPTAAVSWAIQERADKDRYFAEPGFIFGVTVARPKVHLGNQISHSSMLLDNAISWLPAVLRDEVYTSLREIAKDGGLYAGATNDYWLDLRDLFIHGDQYLNYDPVADVDNNTVALPRPDLTWKYPVQADADGLFVGPSKLHVRQDGVVSLTIAGSQKDHT